VACHPIHLARFPKRKLGDDLVSMHALTPILTAVGGFWGAFAWHAILYTNLKKVNSELSLTTTQNVNVANSLRSTVPSTYWLDGASSILAGLFTRTTHLNKMVNMKHADDDLRECERKVPSAKLEHVLICNS
jgi:hypothetical protein